MSEHRDELAELRDYVSDLLSNTMQHWNRAGSREAHEQEGAVRMAQRILLNIDGRIERARKCESQPQGSSVGG